MSETFYVTTPIYYVNDVPHIGHSYTTIAADVLARYHRAAGRDVFFLTGTDENASKVAAAAEQRGIDPQAHCDEVCTHFQDLWKALNISNDDFIRTTQPRHTRRVQDIITRLLQREQIYLGQYTGWYDPGQEGFVTEQVARENEYKSPISGRDLEKYSEPSYFFRLSQWTDRLLAHVEAHPEFIQPESRRNEVVSKVRAGVEDLSISRSSLTWGIEMPNDPAHRVYVWIDALSNYITALGWPEIGDENDGARMKYWPADLQLIGKDILWFHTVYWPCMLMALDVELPRTVFAHGWWTSEGRKMSKSLGNFISRETIAAICDEYSRDVFRYFLLREVPFGLDGDFSREALKTRYNAELANDVGNLLSRTVNMVGRYFDGAVPAPQGESLTGPEAEFLAPALQALHQQAEGLMRKCRFSDYIRAVLDLATATNRYIDATVPFKLAKDPSQRDRLGTILYSCAEAVRIVLSYLEPVIPDKADEGLRQLGLCGGGPEPLGVRTQWGGLAAGTATAKSDPLFPRVS
ncbi:MAG: methionine--tRNA ligase [Planctomycetota bacterium]|jgi:methionyl-tRNA synthetase